ncbi:putative glycoside hydrolase family 43 [Coleophoma cylindrospora]|uniref:Putative glycoside hydrolase family 43 n=1 Tax=Coleophoma cylindrospora TaxID=1849047 RepID=A0A3D8SFI2_9HELO|nr:putative glycoside hydrolase family 43 [Coleophoma cylindrospora]
MASFLSALVALLSLLQFATAATYSNPIRSPDGSDPFIVYTGGYYYFLTTTWTDVEITRATTLEGLKTGTKKVVYSTSTASRCCNVWSPEVHYINGVWYIYYTAGISADLTGQRINVLTGGATPWDTFTYTGQLFGQWSIDATVLRFTTGNYLVFSCMANSQQCLCIAPLNTPTSLGTVEVLSYPTNAWEQVGAAVNEAPAALYHGGKTMLTYSASYCWTASYQLGLLTWNGGDPMLRASWVKTGPVFSSANGNYGTGSNGFFTSPDGTQIWNVFNADSNSAGACDSTRYTMAEIVNWNSDGTPNFGTAPAKGTVLAGPSGE